MNNCSYVDISIAQETAPVKGFHKKDGAAAPICATAPQGVWIDGFYCSAAMAASIRASCSRSFSACFLTPSTTAAGALDTKP